MTVTLASASRAVRLSLASTSRTRAIVGIVAGALLVRLLLAVVMQGRGVIDNDGAEYARSIANLRDGFGFTGMRGVEMTLFPPLYPLLIGFASLATHNDELAGRLVSVVAGALLPLAIFLIAEMLFGRRVAVVAGMLCAVVPLLILLSSAVLTDQTYVTFMTFGLYWTLRARRAGSAFAALAAGLCFGFAYLLRPEGLVLGLAVTFGSFALSFRASARRATAVLGASVAALAIVAAPYVAFMSHAQGKASFEGKMSVNYVIGVRLLKGMSYEEAAQGIADDLTPYGPELNEKVDVAPPSLRDRLAFALAIAPRQAASVAGTVAAKKDGLTPLGALLAVVGFILAWRARDRIALVALTTLLALMSFASLLAVGQYAPRYGALVLAIAVPFAAKGGDAVVAALARKVPRRALVPALGAAAAALALWSAAGVALDVREKLQSVRPLEKAAGVWLHAHDPSRAKSVMATSMIVGYYGDADAVQLPFTRSSDVALAYVARKNPAYVAVVGDPRTPREPYLNGWADHGIPDRRARLIYRNEADGRTIALYCWACRETAAAK